MTSRYKIPTPEGVREVFAQVSAIPESGWSLVVQKPLSEAFADVNKLIVQRRPVDGAAGRPCRSSSPIWRRGG